MKINGIDVTKFYVGASLILSAISGVSSFAAIPGGGGTPPPVINLSEYDTWFGNNTIDSDGMAVFDQAARPAGSKNIYVKYSTGSDATGNPSNPSTPMKNIAAAQLKVTQGKGDYVLLCEGETWPTGMGWIGVNDNAGGAIFDGKDQTAPTLFQSYDPADPTNAAKFGKGHQRNARPKVLSQPQITNGYCPHNIGWRGIDWDQQNQAMDQASNGLQFIGNPLDPAGTGRGLSNVIIENCVFRYCGISIDVGGYPKDAWPYFPTQDSYPGQHVVVRGNSLYGQWTTNPDGRVGGLYQAGLRYFTNEYNAFWHCGWKIDPNITRATPSADGTGGPTVFSHAFYLQMNSDDNIVRGNFSSDNGGDGGTLRGSGIWIGNVSLRNPNAMSLGGGSFFGGPQGVRPNGTYIEAAYNVAINAVDQRPDHELGWGMTAMNGIPGRMRVHHNLLVHSDIAAHGQMLGVSADWNLPSYCLYDHNVGVAWAAPNNVRNWTFPVGYTRGRDVYNIWDAPNKGTNLNNAGVTFPNPLTEQQGYAALGFSGYDAFVQDCINFPEKKTWIALRNMFLAGYNVSVVTPSDTTAPLVSNPTVNVTSGTTATAGITTTENNGQLYWIRTASATKPIKENIMIGFTEDPAGVAALEAGAITVTQAGVQTINLNITEPGDYYIHWCHEDAQCNVSNASTASSGVIHIAGAPTVFAAPGTGTNLTGTSSEWTVTNNGDGTQSVEHTPTNNGVNWAKAMSSQAKTNATVIITIEQGDPVGIGWGAINFGWSDGTEDEYFGHSQSNHSVGFIGDGRLFNADGPNEVTTPNLGNLTVGRKFKWQKVGKVHTVWEWVAGAWSQIATWDYALSSSGGAPGKWDAGIMHDLYFGVSCSGGSNAKFRLDWSAA